MGTPKLLDDHRLAVVGRANQQQVGHPLFGWPREQRLQALQGGAGAGVADPPVRSHIPHPFLVGQPCDLPRGRV